MSRALLIIFLIPLLVAGCAHVHIYTLEGSSPEVRLDDGAVDISTFMLERGFKLEPNPIKGGGLGEAQIFVREWVKTKPASFGEIRMIHVREFTNPGGYVFEISSLSTVEASLEELGNSLKAKLSTTHPGMAVKYRRVPFIDFR